MSAITLVKDIYTGKPDAKDEIRAEGNETFIKSFIAPYNFDIKGLIEGSNCFITGYKGTGKTALLFYLDNFIAIQDGSTCSSFIFFKEEFKDTKKQEFERITKRVVSSIDIDQDILLNEQDFEYIWRWTFYKRIIEDNEDFNGGLFIADNYWHDFVGTIRKILNKEGHRKINIPSRIKVAVPFNDPSTMATISPQIEVDLQNGKNFDEYRLFTQLIDEAEEQFKQVKRTDIPYYIFIDELEAYYGEQAIFERDLRLIRDLIFTVKYFNNLFICFGQATTKIICSVRAEIINAINRFIVTKEMNKVTSGFECPLIWDYNNTNSFSHPIMSILIKRIEMAENKNSITYTSSKEIFQKWFPENIDGFEPANYILNNTWCKPRDVVRLLLATKNCLDNNREAFTQSVFHSSFKKYSMESLIEIKEEMRALYSSKEIDTIVNCLTGFRVIFSIEELQIRATRYFPNSLIAKDLVTVLRDLYRLGVVGNYSTASKSHRWQHKGFDGLIVSDEWKIMIHRALQNALSVSTRHDKGVLHTHNINPENRGISQSESRYYSGRIFAG